MIKFIGFFVVLISLCSAWLWSEYNHALVVPVVLESNQTIEINRGDSFQTITDKLIAKKIQIQPLWFKIIAYEQKVLNRLKAGDYQLTVGLTTPEILALFVQGKSRQYSITFPEGWNFKQVLQALNDNPQIKNTLNSHDYQGLMIKLDSPYQHPEGLFFPDTYFFDKNTTDIAILKRAYQKMQQVLTVEWQNKETGLPLKNAYQALILASIVEKETGVARERPEIAGVFVRRLHIGMLLQTDPTVIYGMGDAYQGNIRRKDLRKPTIYNTYVIKGLPPTPIAMAGQHAIHSALHPAQGKALYFVARGDGSHVFSATLRAHNNAVNKFQRNQ